MREMVRKKEGKTGEQEVNRPVKLAEAETQGETASATCQSQWVCTQAIGIDGSISKNHFLPS